MTNSLQKYVGIAILFIAYGLLYPGLTLPLLALTGYVDKADLVSTGSEIIINNPEMPRMVAELAQMVVNNMEFSGTLEVYEKTRSILGTVKELYRNEFVLVAFLVALFSIIIPVIKGILILVVNVFSDHPYSASIQKLNAFISKWSMADVFVVGVFVAYLAANAIKKEGGLISFEAQLGPGFYYFLGYCLVSILGTQILVASAKPRQNKS